MPPLTLPPSRLLRLFSPCSFLVKDDEVSPHDADLGPRKRRVVDGGDGVPMVVDLSEVSLGVEVQDDVTTLVEGYVGAVLEVPRLEEADVAASSHSEGKGAIMITPSEDPTLPGREEALSVKLAQEASPTDKGKGKMPAEQCDEQAGTIGDESDFDFNPETH